MPRKPILLRKGRGARAIDPKAKKEHAKRSQAIKTVFGIFFT